MFIKFTESLAINVDEIYTIKHDSTAKKVRIDTVRGEFEFENSKYNGGVETEVKQNKCLAEVTNFGLINMNLISKYSYINAASKHYYTIYFKTNKGEKVMELNDTIVTGLDDTLKNKLEEYKPYKGEMMLYRRASKDE